MGCNMSRKIKPMKPTPAPKIKFQSISDQFNTIDEVSDALREQGLDACQLIVGIDFTKTNNWAGNATFGGKCLHSLEDPPNPYLRTLSLIARTLGQYNQTQNIPCYGFGDVSTKADSVFSFRPENTPSHNLDELLFLYRNVASHVQLDGPASFGPLIRQAMRCVYENEMQFTVLLIISNGQISHCCLEDTVSAIVEASSFPISIIMIGVGDGPWDTMNLFDDKLPQRKWDNFQFVELNKHFIRRDLSMKQQETAFALNALMEVPIQYKFASVSIGIESMDSVKSIYDKIPESILKDPPEQVAKRFFSTAHEP